MAHDVFVSYSSRDRVTADAVVARLEGAGLRCWVAPRDILPGMEWGEGIIDGINRSRVMVLVFSSNANASPQIRREVERAVNKGLPIIPFRIEEVMPSRSLEYFLSSPHWLDALTPPIEAHIKRLSGAVTALLSRLEGTETQAAPAEAVRARVQKVVNTMLGRPARVVSPGPVPGLAAAPGVVRKPGARPPQRPAAPVPLGLLIAFVALLAIALFALVFTGRPRTRQPAPARAPSPAAAPAAASASSAPVIRPTAGSPGASAAPAPSAAASDSASAQHPPRVRATYECRSGVKFSIDPDKATVTIDGRRAGIAEDFYHHAYTFSHPGTHYAKLSLRGYHTDYVKILVRPGAGDENADIKLDLRRSN